MAKYSYTFNLSIQIQNPADVSVVRQMDFRVDVIYIPDNYGNGYHMYFTGQNYSDGLDIRYDKTFDPNMPELYIMDYVYSHWSGEKMSWKAIGVTLVRTSITPVG